MLCVYKMYQTNKGGKNVNCKLRVGKPGATEINMTINIYFWSNPLADYRSGPLD